MPAERFRVIGRDGVVHDTDRPGEFGGHRRTRIYGRLDCRGAQRAIARGGYVTHRVFFADEAAAVAAGYRPCWECLRPAYRQWKLARSPEELPVPAEAWRVSTYDALTGDLLAGAGRPVIVGVDGRTASGKSTFAARLAAAGEGALVHTDDLAWHHSTFGWDDLLVREVLEPLRRGMPVAYRPPGWRARGRQGAVVVPVAPLIVVEGVGSCRDSLAGRYDLSVWVETTHATWWRRERERIALGRVPPEVSREWLAEEVPWLSAHQPWRNARLTVAGEPLRALTADQFLMTGT